MKITKKEVENIIAGEESSEKTFKKKNRSRPRKPYVSPEELSFWGGRRLKALTRDNFKCTDCGQRASEVDHIVPLRMGGSRYNETNVLNNLENLTSKCHQCHSKSTFYQVGEERIARAWN